MLDPSYENIENRLLWLVHDDDSINDEMIDIRRRLYQDPKVNPSLRRPLADVGMPRWRCGNAPIRRGPKSDLESAPATATARATEPAE